MEGFAPSLIYGYNLGKGDSFEEGFLGFRVYGGAVGERRQAVENQPEFRVLEVARLYLSRFDG